MKTFVLAATMGAALAGPAMAADMIVRKAPPPPPVAASQWDIAFGAAIMSDYNFRGISQSARNPSVGAYFEPRFNVNPNLQLYAGIAGASIDFPNHSAAEIDFYAGFRPTFGKLALDFGFWYYLYPGGTTFDGLTGPTSCTNLAVTPTGFCNILKGNVSFWELYAKATYSVTDSFALGANVFYSPDWLNTSASGTYLSATAKYTLPPTVLPSGIGAFVSAEIGRYFLGTTDVFYSVPLFPAGVNLPDYTTWNIGLGLTYKVFTLDLRYFDTNLSKTNCNVLTGDHTAAFNPAAVSAINPAGLESKWCGSAFIAKLSVDTTLSALK